MNIKTKLILPAVLTVGIVGLTGCKAYDKPEFVEVKPNQTAFVIPLEGTTSDQGKFESEAYLQKMQVATKRIEIPHRWIKTGRGSGTGEYVDTVRVIIVDRLPVNRQWFNDASRSSDGKQSGFIGESKDSIKFKIGLTATAKIEEKNTAKFLYQYSGKELQTVMDTEIRNKLGTTLLEEYGSMSMEEIRSHKAEVIAKLREEATPYFEQFGITLQNIGYVGDLEYVDSNVQDAINKAFNAQQDQQAQAIKNKTEIDKARAEATANNTRKESMKEIAEMKKLDLQAKWIEKWDGKLPSTTTGDNAGVMMNIGK
jgi:hypothetical protein